MKPDLLVVTPIYPPTLAELEREYTVDKLWLAEDPEAFLAEVSGRVRGVVTVGSIGLVPGLIESLPRLEIVGCVGTPHGTVDLAAARARGVVVTNTPDSITESVADLAIGLAIAVMRRICETDRFVRAGKWLAGLPPMGAGLGGKTCGIVGLGAIGRGVARRAEACGMAVCYHGPREKPGLAYPYYADLEEMARRADCLVVTCWLTPATRGLVDSRILGALGPSGFLVNVARGPIVEEAALIAALEHGRIAGAALDVYWDEPRVPAALLGMENVVLVPHIGSSTREVREARGEKLLANLRAHFAGRPAPNPVAMDRA
ncbi:MAG: 2-hydroxyacid dehydrogenase [Betaproteobacteria bacterium]|nr:2-hydroxyacid dehydrogenase [Betaproteobacteria bacterium]MDH3437426.1 2-hydroxyacid dehydrogenase [Betaproteobacteria bacterium]